MEIAGRTFVVTGAGAGIGREVALLLLQRGGRVAGVDLNADGLAGTGTLAAQDADRWSAHAVDVCDRAAVDGLIGDVLAQHGQLDGLLNVAGIIQPFLPLEELSIEAIAKVMNVNFWGVVHTTKAALPHLLARPQACVVNVSSMGGFTPVPGQTAYGASKAAVKLLTEGLYAESRGTSVAVSVVFPGAVATEISANSGVHIDAPADAPAFPTTSPRDAAHRIVDEAVVKGRYRVLVGKDATMLDRISRLAPQRATDMIAKKMASLLG